MAQDSVTSGKVTLFPQDPQCGVTYRIPALLFIPPDTFLAFAEERSSLSDEDAKNLVLRRGTKKENTVEWGPLEPLTSATKDGYRTMNPCPVYERESQTVFLFFICVEGTVSEEHQIKTGQNAARLCYVRSTDAGQTWSPLTDLTEEVIGKDLKNWATFAVGPGHGVQLNSGRLVIPAYAYNITAPSVTQGYTFTFYSDDKGQKWLKGKLVQHVETEEGGVGKVKKIEMLECQVAEVVCQNGDTVEYSLYCNARTPHKFRAEALSTDKGLTFTSPSLREQLCETGIGCQGSVVSYTPTPASSWLLYSHPTHNNVREDLGIYLKTSPSEEAKWKGPWILHKGPSGYSDLAVCQGPPLLFGCLFECGKELGKELKKEIAFQLFTEEDLQKNIGFPRVD